MTGLIIAVLIIWPIFFGASYCLLNLAGLNLHDHPLSKIGAKPKIGKYFNILLISVGLFQLYLFYYFYSNNQLLFNMFGVWGFTCLVVTTITGVLVGIINEGVSIKIHNLISIAGFIACIPGWILFGLQLFNEYFYRSLVLITWGLIVMPLVAVLFYRNKKACAKLEIFMFIGAFITDIILVSIL